MFEEVVLEDKEKLKGKKQNSKACWRGVAEKKWRQYSSSAGRRKHKQKGTDGAKFAFFFSADFQGFLQISLVLRITASRKRRFPQKTARNRRFSQKTAAFRRNRFVPFSFSLLTSALKKLKKEETQEAKEELWKRKAGGRQQKKTKTSKIAWTWFFSCLRKQKTKQKTNTKNKQKKKEGLGDVVMWRVPSAPTSP